MVKNDGAETRRQRIHQIVRMVQAALFESGESGETSLSKLIGAAMYQMGLTRKTVLEYLEVTQTTGQCELDVDNDKIRKPRI